MKKIAGLCTVVLALLLQVGGAFAQTSDYEIIQTFKSKSSSLMESLKSVEDAGQCALLGTEVDRLQSDYGPHRKLLAEGLYPQTFDTAIAALRDQVARSTERIRLAEESRRDKEKMAADAKTITDISQQNVEYKASVEKLTVEVSELGARVQKLTDENTGLLEKIKVLQLENKKDKESIAKLKELTDKLNANIRDRDALVLKMMDGMFNEYSKAELTDAQKKDLFVSAQRNDYVGKIISTVDGNVKYAESGLLTAKDVQLARDEQKKLAVKWAGIKPYVGKLYQDEQAKVRDMATVDTRVEEWKKGIDTAVWKGVHQVFVGQRMDIGSFANATEFHARLVAYLDGQVKNPSRDQYQAFRRQVWDSPMKDQWLPVISTDELTAAQRSDIEQRIALWDKKSSAILWQRLLIGLLGAVLIVVLAVVLRKKKKPPTTA